MIDIKGKGSVGLAIAYYSLRGKVSIPLESCSYNLLFDNDTSISRIKVISCCYKTKYGVYTVSIKTMGAYTNKNFDENSCDFVFIATKELDLFEIPAKEITSKRAISLQSYAKYKVFMNHIPS